MKKRSFIYKKWLSFWKFIFIEHNISRQLIVSPCSSMEGATIPSSRPFRPHMSNLYLLFYSAKIKHNTGVAWEIREKFCSGSSERLQGQDLPRCLSSNDLVFWWYWYFQIIFLVEIKWISFQLKLASQRWLTKYRYLYFIT